ncbi:MAG: amidohydrolase family protein [Marinicellaceae bacterium]
MVALQIFWSSYQVKFIVILFFLFVINLSDLQAKSAVIKAKGFINVQSGKLIKPAVIVIENEKIVAINPDNLPAESHIIDLNEKILLPGLMDMHTHLDADFTGSFDHIITKENASKGAIRAAKNAEKTLMAGFTTVRNVGQLHFTKELVVVAAHEAAQEGWIKAPHIIAAGHMISIEGGHGDLSLGFTEELLDVDADHGIVNGTQDALKAVRFQIKNGAKFIKIHATAGVLSLEESVGAQQLSDEEMKVIVDEAQRHGIRVAAHAHGAEGIKAAIRAGVHSIEHGSLLDEEGIKLMKKHNVFLVPTTGLVDKVMIDIDKINPIMAKKAQYVLPLAQKNLKRAIKSGVKIALGTDAPLIPHGENAYEFSAMVDKGMSHAEAIKTATINSAELLNLDDRGQIKLGFLADIIAVNDNPLENIKTLEKVDFVMKAGKIYKNQ